jgi:hypothetical protein
MIADNQFLLLSSEGVNDTAAVNTLYPGLLTPPDPARF